MKMLVLSAVEEVFKKTIVHGREIEVSNLGTVRYEDTRVYAKEKIWVRYPKDLPLRKERNEYLSISFGKKKIHIHVLVATLFVRKPQDDSKEYVVWFIDRDRSNVKANNLIWISRDECNQRMSLDYAGRNKTNDGRTKLLYDSVKDIRKRHEEGVGVMQLAKEYKVSHTQIKRIVRRENFTYI